MDSDAYLEKILAEAYERECDQEENVARSLPFFAASLALLASILGLSRSALPPFGWSLYPLIAYGCLAAIASAVPLVVWFLAVAVRPRRFAYLMREDDLRAYVTQLHEYYGKTGASDADIEDAVVADVRQAMIDQYAQGAMQNRGNNVARTKARAFALTALVIALGFAFFLIGAILTHGIKMDGDEQHASAARADRGSSQIRSNQGQHDRQNHFS